MECTFPDLERVSLDDALRIKVKLRYRELLEKILALPLWETYYNTQIKAWIAQVYPELNTPPKLSASAIVRYLVQTYSSLTGGGFLFRETSRAAFVAALTPLKTKNYLFQYLVEELETRRPEEETCRPSFLEDVASLIETCLQTRECRRPVEEALFVVSLPTKVKHEFNQHFLADLRDRYTKKKALNDTFLKQIEPLELTFFQTHSGDAAAYLNAAASPLAFLNTTNVLGKVSQTFKAKVRGGVFRVKDLWLAKPSHLWPELVVKTHQLSNASFDRFQRLACDAIQQEIQTILGRPARAEGEEKEGWEKSLANLEKMCETRDLRRSVFYYTGGKFVCFREDVVLHDIERGNTRKYPAGFVEKMKKRGGEPLSSPVVGAVDRVEISRQKDRDRRSRYTEVDLDAQQNTFNELEARFGRG